MKAHQGLCDSESSQWPDSGQHSDPMNYHEDSPPPPPPQKLPKQMSFHWIRCNMLKLKNYLQLRTHHILHRRQHSGTL